MRKSARRNVATIKVLRNYDGFTAELVEVVERQITRHSGVGRKQDRAPRPYRTVSYKGQRYTTFGLPPSYGEIAGTCICIDR